jgi:hypothetical protein
MTELLISEITLMGSGFCVIGLERNQDHFRSLRPIPRGSYAWNKFQYRRADKVAFDLSAMLVLPAHIEDRAARKDAKRGSVAEMELVKCLKQAEVATSVKELFGCDVHSSPRGGAAVYVDPKDGKRSIGGCEVESVRFSLKFFPPKIRIALVLKSGESLQSLPIVDVEWLGFAVDLESQVKDCLEHGTGRSGEEAAERARSNYGCICWSGNALGRSDLGLTASDSPLCLRERPGPKCVKMAA